MLSLLFGSFSIQFRFAEEYSKLNGNPSIKSCWDKYMKMYNTSKKASYQKVTGSNPLYISIGLYLKLYLTKTPTSPST